MENYSDIHKNMLVVDGHCDTLLDLYNNNRSFWEHNKAGHLDWPRLKLGKINLQFMAIYIEPQYKPFGALCRTLEILDYYHSLNLTTLTNKEHLNSLNPNSHLFLLAIEGGEALEGKLSTLRVLFKLGIRSITLTWNQRNKIADGVGEKESRGGLTNFGREVIKEMNRLGMLIDVSHLSEPGFWDVISLSKAPIAATHSCCSALYDHPRNLTDKQLKALGEKQGIIGINFFPGFLGNKSAKIDDVVAHIEHAAEYAGLDHVGIGSDFDGIETTPEGLEDATMLPKLTETLLKRNWQEDNVHKVLGGNFIRVLQEVLPE